MERFTLREWQHLLKPCNKVQAKGLVVYYASMYRLCEAEGRLPYYEQILNRLYRESAQHDLLLKHLHFNPNLPNDLFLDDKGVAVAFDILAGYFDEKVVLELYRNLSRKNRLEHDIYLLEHAFDTAPTAKLKELLPLYEAYTPKTESEAEAKQSLIDRIRGEIKRRRNPWYCLKALCVGGDRV